MPLAAHTLHWPLALGVLLLMAVMMVPPWLAISWLAKSLACIRDSPDSGSTEPPIASARIYEGRPLGGD